MDYGAQKLNDKHPCSDLSKQWMKAAAYSASITELGISWFPRLTSHD